MQSYCLKTVLLFVLFINRAIHAILTKRKKFLFRLDARIDTNLELSVYEWCGVSERISPSADIEKIYLDKKRRKKVFYVQARGPESVYEQNCIYWRKANMKKIV